MISNQSGNCKPKETGLLPSGWETVPAEKFCKRVTDGTHATPQKQKSGHYLITSRHIKEGYLDFKNAYSIDDTDFQEANKRSWVSKWDVIFGMIGTIGEVYIEKSDKIDYAIKNVGLFSCGEELLGKWIYFYMKSRMAKEYIRKNRSGTTQEYMTLGSLRKFPISFPRNNLEMKTIVSILESIQHKFELNNQMNDTLDAIGQVLFRHWFVDFEFPNNAGKPYKSTGGEMEYNEALDKLVPKDWEVKSLSEIAQFLRGFSYSGSEKSNESGEFVFITLNSIREGGGFKRDFSYLTVID